MLLGEDKEVFESAALSGIAASKELITKDELLKIMNKQNQDKTCKEGAAEVQGSVALWAVSQPRRI